MSMTFEDWIRTQNETRATVGVRLGMAEDGSHASFMSWSDKKRGTWFWSVSGSTVTLLEFMGDEPNPAEICQRCMTRRDRHAGSKICTETESN